jgi:hypothetical protein
MKVKCLQTAPSSPVAIMDATLIVTRDFFAFLKAFEAYAMYLMNK